MKTLKQIATEIKDNEAIKEEAIQAAKKARTKHLYSEGAALSFLKSGKTHFVYRCNSCHKVSETAEDLRSYGGYFRRSIRCISCGHEIYKVWVFNSNYNTKLTSEIALAKKIEDGFVIVIYNIELNCFQSQSMSPAEMLANIPYEVDDVNLTHIIVFSDVLGPALFTGKGLSRIHKAPKTRYWRKGYDDLIGDVKAIETAYGISIGKTEGIEGFWNIVSGLPYSNEASDKAKNEEKKKKKEKEEASILSYRKDVESEFNRIASTYYVPDIMAFDTSGSGQTIYACYCGSCGNSFVSNQNINVYCEDCGERIDNVVVSSSKVMGLICLVDWSVDTDKNLILTQYSAKVNPVGDKKDWIRGGRQHYAVEPSSIQVKTQVKFINKPVARPIKKIGKDEIFSSKDCMYTLTPLKDVIGDSVFKYCNVEKVGDDLIKTTDYLQNVARYPFIVGLMSRGLDKAASQLLSEIKDSRTLPAQYRGKTDVREALGISKGVLKLATKYQLDWYTIKLLKAMMNVDSSLNYECFDWLNTNLRNDECQNCINMVKEINSHVVKPVHFEEIRTYIKSMYYDQGIDYTAGLQTWEDYLKCMDYFGFKPAVYRKKLFPTSLKKDHDILYLAVRNINKEEKAEAFKDTIESGHRLEYSFEDLMVRMPQTVEEIVEEGVHLHHSVAQHIEKVADKLEYIAFIREKSDPDTPYYTVEVLREGRGKIVQVRSFSNLPADDRIKAFLKKWASYKKLEIVSL